MADTNRFEINGLVVVSSPSTYRDSLSTNLLHTPTPPPRPQLVLCIHRKKGDLMDYLMNFLAQLLCFYGPLTNTP